jgi:uncharacterized protein involved in tolerance to divalent cations
MFRLIGATLILVLFSGCSKTDQTTVSFYYWKTIFKLSSNEKEILEENNVSRIYVRYFDVALKNGQPIPLSPIDFEEPPAAMAIVPVIYIKNEVFLKQQIDLNNLTDKILAYVDQINEKSKIDYKEIQIDCDWTLKSKEQYMKFVDLFKKKCHKTLSATIRLHQIKYYRGTGTPNVDRGVLMYYNMGRIAPDSLNSIYDRVIAKRYIESLKSYPLPLAIALPIYSWGIQIRNNKVIALINKTDAPTFSNDAHFIEVEEPFFEVKENVIKLGYYFQKGDRIKVESISSNDVREMANDLSENLKESPSEVIFYDLDDFNFKNYKHEKKFFEKVSNIF